MSLFNFLKKKESDPPKDLGSLNTEMLGLDSGLPKLDADLNLPPLDLGEMPQMPALQSQQASPLPQDFSSEINQLFLSDPWKEPDWGNYDPYEEPHIDPPTEKDFGMAQPSQNSRQYPQEYEVPEFKDEEHRELPENLPYDVFVKGTDYRRIISEMEEIKKMLTSQDTRMDVVSDVFKKEESTIVLLKDNMEGLYRRMLSIDKKVFT